MRAVDARYAGNNPFGVLFTLPNVENFPQLRFMGSKYRLLPWIHDVLSEYKFASSVDAFSGSGCVSYLLKTMGKSVLSNDFLLFCAQITKATIENEKEVITEKILSRLLRDSPGHEHFVENTFTDIFYSPSDLRFLDLISWNIRSLTNPYLRALAQTALTRSCIKRQPRGVFTVAGDPEHYKDGRRDLRLSLQEHFLEQVEIYNRCVFANHCRNRSIHGDIFDLKVKDVDLVYMDPPYVPRSDDNCYVKRYHFLEGLVRYWDGVKIMESSRVKKIEKSFTPFSYRKTAIDAFDRLFCQFSESILVLSYSSNGYPDLEILISLMKKYKKSVQVFTKNHRYHFGTHVNAERNQVQEYLIVGHH